MVGEGVVWEVCCAAMGIVAVETEGVVAMETEGVVAVEIEGVETVVTDGIEVGEVGVRTEGLTCPKL